MKINHEEYDVIIVGAGPAGLFFAREISLKAKATVKALLIDKGSSISNRYCNYISNDSCSKCAICQNVHGVGGAGMYSDGKLSSYPAGSMMKKFLAVDAELINVVEYVINIIKKGSNFHGSYATYANNVEPRLHDRLVSAGLSMKDYDVKHLGTRGVRNSVVFLENFLKEAGVNFLLDNEVYDVVAKKNSFIVKTENCNTNEKNVYTAKNVVIATGKSSALAMRKIYNNIGVRYDFNAVELGVRVETSRAALMYLAQQHLDAKIKCKLEDDIEVRTFCLCDGGRVIGCHYDSFIDNEKICILSGFSDFESKTSNSNFGLLVRRTFPKSIDTLSLHLNVIRKLKKFSPCSGVLIQRYEDFLLSRETLLEKLNQNTVVPTYKHILPTNLWQILPHYVCSSIANFLEKFRTIFPAAICDDALLYAPVLELCPDMVCCNSFFCTNVDGFYVIGDANGWMRGIVQSAVSGVVSAKSFVEARISNREF